MAADPPSVPGAVPRFMSPEQVTAPLPMHPAPPWVQFQPPPERKKDGHAWDAAKLLGVVLTICTFIFGAGAANEKLKNIESARKAEADQQAQRTRLQDDRDEKLKSAVDGLAIKVEMLTEQVKQQARERRWRHVPGRPPVDDRP